MRTVGAVTRIEVEDDGPGVPGADRERVSELFVRLDESRTRGSGGTGLGLAIAREISVAHGGSLHVEAGGCGARFVLVLRGPRPGPSAAPWCALLRRRSEGPSRPRTRRSTTRSGW